MDGDDGTVRLTRVTFDDLAGWAADDHATALTALRRTALHVADDGPHRTGRLGIRGETLLPALERSLMVSDREARAFFEALFTPHRVEGEGLGGPDGRGFVTGFYEPVIDAALERDDTYRFPIHAKPPELVRNDGSGGLDPAYAWGVRDADGAMVEAPDRAAIETGALEKQPPFDGWPVIAWARDRIELFIVHVQGAARLRLPDGSIRRITYAAKSGHPFTGIGRELVAMGELTEGRVTLRAIREWLAAHPERVDELLRRNRSYIFFREAEVTDPALGPVAAARVPLAPGRSLAVDRLLHTFGTPVFVEVPGLAYEGRTFERLMIAQETGTAIVGAARGDIFTGSGYAAGEVAGAITHPATFTLLLPRDTGPSPG